MCFLRRERSKVPYIVRQCVEEVERRGMEEVGIYRVSGVATDIQALKAAFDASEYIFHLLLPTPDCIVSGYPTAKKIKYSLYVIFHTG